MKKLGGLGFVIAGALCAATLPAAADVKPATFRSASLGREVNVTVDLPPSYATSPNRRYPVVVALHGLFEGPSFLERRGLSAAIEELWKSGRVPEFVLVAVDGDPLGDIRLLQQRDRIKVVWKGGKICVDRRAGGVAVDDDRTARLET